MSKNQILTSIKGRNSVANMRKTMIYNTNVDLDNDNVYTKFGLNRSIRFQDIEQNLNRPYLESAIFEMCMISISILVSFERK